VYYGPRYHYRYYHYYAPRHRYWDARARCWR
jgi:hypothetical protein